jgi:hypothetical protein
MKKFIIDVINAAPRAHEEARRELALTLTVTAGAFVIIPIVFTALITPLDQAAPGFLRAFTSTDIYIASISLLSISIYSISKEYQSEGRDRFGFPHAATIMVAALLILLLAIAAYTARMVADALPSVVLWRGSLAQTLGWAVFIISSATAYAVLVLRNDIEGGAPNHTRDEERDFVQKFASGEGVA